MFWKVQRIFGTAITMLQKETNKGEKNNTILKSPK
jgi:hypothetical protein